MREIAFLEENKPSVMRPTLQTVPENSTATANQPAAAAAAVPTTPNGTRGAAEVVAVEKMTSSSNHTTAAASVEKPTATHQPPQAQQLAPVKARNSARVSITQSFLITLQYLSHSSVRVCACIRC